MNTKTKLEKKYNIYIFAPNYASDTYRMWVDAGRPGGKRAVCYVPAGNPYQQPEMIFRNLSDLRDNLEFFKKIGQNQ